MQVVSSICEFDGKRFEYKAYDLFSGFTIIEDIGGGGSKLRINNIICGI